MPPGILRLIKAKPNPHGAENTQLYLFTGNPTVAPVREIIPGDGVVLPPRADPPANQFRRLKVFHINDLHGHIGRFTPQGDRPILSRIVSRLRDVRCQYEDDPYTAVLAMSAGDDLVGAIFDELMGEGLDSFALHAGYRLYSAAGIDVSALGNHDIDLGTDTLARAIRQDARFPILSANVVGCQWLSGFGDFEETGPHPTGSGYLGLGGQEGTPLLFPAALFVIKGIRVGIIGLTTPGQVRQPTNSNLQIVNPVRVMHNMLPAIRPLCDVLIILSHLGYTLTATSATMREAGDVELARSLPYGCVHLIVGGHTHSVLNEQGLTANNIVNGIPIVQAGTLGRFLGEVDITIRQGLPAVTNVRLKNTAYLAVDDEFEEEHVKPLMDIARPLFTRSLGSAADDPDLSTDAVRNGFAAGESALANFITDALFTRCWYNNYHVDLSLIDSSTVRCGLQVGGNLTYGDWFDLMPFADVLRITWVTGQQLFELLQDNALRIDLPGEPHTERGFLHFSRQIRYSIQAGSSRRELVATDITIKGEPIEKQLERSFQIVCSNFVREAAVSWEKYAVQSLGVPLMNFRQVTNLDTTLYLREEMVAYIKEAQGVTAEGGARRDGRVRLVINA
jgi:5'-nucleotidase / UDP-sugar diphosphatase